MESKIFLIALTKDGDLSTSIIFQKFGNDFSNHPNLLSFFEYTENDETGAFTQAVRDFKVSTLPTIIFTQYIDQEPVKLIPIVRVVKDITYDGLVKIFNKIISGEIPIPEEGNQGVVADAEGENINPVNEGTGIGGGLGVFDFNWSKWVLIGLGIFGIFKLANREEEEEDKEEDTKIL